MVISQFTSKAFGDHPTNLLTAAHFIGNTILQYHYSHRLIRENKNALPNPIFFYDKTRTKRIARKQSPLSKKSHGKRNIAMLKKPFDKIQHCLEHANVSYGYTMQRLGSDIGSRLSWECTRISSCPYHEDSHQGILDYPSEMKAVIPASATTFAIGCCYLLTPFAAPRHHKKKAQSSFASIRNEIKHCEIGQLLADSTTIYFPTAKTPTIPSENMKTHDAQAIIQSILTTIPHDTIEYVLDHECLNKLKEYRDATLDTQECYLFEMDISVILLNHTDVTSL